MVFRYARFWNEPIANLISHPSTVSLVGTDCRFSFACICRQYRWSVFFGGDRMVVHSRLKIRASLFLSNILFLRSREILLSVTGTPLCSELLHSNLLCWLRTFVPQVRVIAFKYLFPSAPQHRHREV